MDEENEKNKSTSTENKEEVKVEKEDVNPISTEEPEKAENNGPITEESSQEENNQEPNSSDSNVEKPKKKKKGLIISIVIIILALIIGAICGVVYALVFSPQEIDLSKYVSFDTERSYNGYSSFDESDLNVDTKGLRKIIDEKKTVSKLEEKILEKSTVEDNDHIKNGDKIKVTVKISDDWLKEYKIKLKSKTFEITIKDLEDAEVIDLFEDVSLDFSEYSVSPDLSVSISNSNKNDFVKNDVYYTMSVNGKSFTSSLDGIKNGDQITVKANFDESDLARAGYAVDETEKVYTVEGQQEYLKDVSKLSQKAKDTLASKALEKAKSDSLYNNYYVENLYSLDYTYNLTAGTPELQKSLLATTDKTGYSYDDNKVFYIYKVTYTDSNTQNTFDYFLVETDNDIIIKSEDVESSLYFSEFSSYSKFYYDDEAHKTLDSTINAIKSCCPDYTFVEY